MSATTLVLALACCVAQESREAQDPQTVSVRVKATVLDDRMQPLAGVAVAVVDEIDERMEEALAHPAARSDVRGDCDLRVEVSPATTRWLVFGGPGLAMQTRELGADPPSVDLGAFAMAPGMTLAGRVRDAAGAPVEGAMVEAADQLDHMPYFREQRSGMEVTFRSAARTDARGFFRVPGMVRSAGRITVRCDGYDEQVLAHVCIGEPVDLVLREAEADRVSGEPDVGSRARRGEHVVVGEKRSRRGGESSAAVSLRGRAADAPAGAAVRLQRFGSAAFSPLPFDGSQRIRPDGTFVFERVPAATYRVELVLAAPARGGRRLVLDDALVCGPGGDDDVDVPEARFVEGRVAGPVPWQRLAVTAMWRRPRNSYSTLCGIAESMALLRPDRSFSLFTPARDVHLVVVDIETGVMLDWQERTRDARGPVEFGCEAVSVVIDVAQRDPRTTTEYQVEYSLTRECWPEGVGQVAPFELASQLNYAAMSIPMRVGPRTTLWLRRRAGKLAVTHGGMPWATFELDDVTPSYSVPLPFR